MVYRARYGQEPVTDFIEGHLVTINRGEFIFGRKSWSERLGISEQRLRTLIKKLIKDEMIEVVKKYNKFTHYKIKNYEKYNQQSNQQFTLENEQIEEYGNQQNNQHLTTSQPPANHQLTTKEQSSNKDNKDNKDIYILTQDEEEFLSILSKIEKYPLDRKKDLEMYKTLTERYPSLNLTEAIQQWSTYKLDKPLTSKSNARSQINTAFKKYFEWGKCLKKGGNTVDRKGNNAEIEGQGNNWGHIGFKGTGEIDDSGLM